MTGPDQDQHERQLFRRVARGDAKSFGALFDLHAPALNSELLAAGHPPARAESILQRTFVALWVAAPRLPAASRVSEHLHHLVTFFSTRPASSSR